MAKKSLYTAENTKEILEGLASGLSLRQITKKNKKLPKPSTIVEWTQHEDKKDFAEQYRSAREIGWEVRADDILDVPDDTVVVYYDELGNKRIDSGSVQLGKLKSFNLMWALSKLLPKKYGDKVEPEKPKGETIIKPHEAVEVTINAEPMPERYKVES